MSKVRTFSQAEDHGQVQGTERTEIRKHAKEKRQPKVSPVFPSEGNPAPEPM
jgi:hypothetical protein